jgi:hypothetical protein
MRYAVCGNNRSYNFCTGTIPLIRFLLLCRMRYAARQNESLEEAANAYDFLGKSPKLRHRKVFSHFRHDVAAERLKNRIAKRTYGIWHAVCVSG